MTKSPHELADERILMSAEYGKLSDELANLLDDQARFFNTNRQAYKSDKAVERAWDVTEKGMRTTRVKLKLKALEKQMSSITQLLGVLNAESRNQW